MTQKHPKASRGEQAWSHQYINRSNTYVLDALPVEVVILYGTRTGALPEHAPSRTAHDQATRRPPF